MFDRPVSSNRDHDLARQLARAADRVGFQKLLGLGRFFQRKHPADLGLQLAGFEPVVDLAAAACCSAGVALNMAKPRIEQSRG